MPPYTPREPDAVAVISAGLLGVEAGRYLHHEGDILVASAVIERDVLSARHLAFAGGDLALRVHIGAIQP